MPHSPAPLTGIRVLDASTLLAGPIICQLLGDFGADVVKIEHPEGGDSLRTHGPDKDGHGLWWKVVGRNKRSIGLYLGEPDGAAVFRALVRTADVLVENFRPGTLERWGLGYDDLKEINPRLVLVRVTGFGQDGPYSPRPGFGTLAEAMSGFAAITGEPDGPPTLPPFGLADSIAGLTGAVAALMGLYHRDARGGPGQQIDLTILEPIIAALGPQATWHDQLGHVQQRRGNRSEHNAPRNTYRTSDDRWVAVSASTTSIAERILRLVGHPEVVAEPWFGSGAARAARADLIDGYVADWIAERSRDEVVAAFEGVSAAIAPVYDVAELVADDHVVAREIFKPVDDPDLGPVRMQDVTFRMSETPGGVRHTGRRLGADTDEILIGELGLDPALVAALRDRGVVA
jgi:crotonobetainyl-CoA:carnitine CoA-transferase CaiB-like acyl-CoA transferase